jgi:hypothetical protein
MPLRRGAGRHGGGTQWPRAGPYHRLDAVASLRRCVLVASPQVWDNTAGTVDECLASEYWYCSCEW